MACLVMRIWLGPPLTSFQASYLLYIWGQMCVTGLLRALPGQDRILGGQICCIGGSNAITIMIQCQSLYYFAAWRVLFVMYRLMCGDMSSTIDVELHFAPCRNWAPE